VAIKSRCELIFLHDSFHLMRIDWYLMIFIILRNIGEGHEELGERHGGEGD